VKTPFCAVPAETSIGRNGQLPEVQDVLDAWSPLSCGGRPKIDDEPETIRSSADLCIDICIFGGVFKR
jgi:hypothetical protein